MSDFFPHACRKCGATGEAQFRYAGPHVKQVCNRCGFYVKFFDKALIPDVRTIREKIWFVTGGNLEVIESAKLSAEFIPNLTGLSAKMMWWKVYLLSRILMPK